MSIHKNEIISTLQKITHPGSGKDIITLNLVRDINIKGNKISYTLFLNDPFIKSIPLSFRSLTDFEHILDVQIRLTDVLGSFSLIISAISIIFCGSF